MLHNYSLACQATSLAPLRVARRRIKKRENEKKRKKNNKIATTSIQDWSREVIERKVSTVKQESHTTHTVD